MNHPKLILLNGFAASGKTTLAKRYLDDHPLALAVEGDVLIGMLGRWRENVAEAESLKMAMESSLVAAHLRAGHDVILPMLSVDPAEAVAYEKLAHEVSATLVEVLLDLNREVAVLRLLKRGNWGEAGLPPLTEADRPKIERKYDQMMEAMSQRGDIVRICPSEGDIEESYTEFIAATKRRP